MNHDSSAQRIARLTPLSTVIAAMQARVMPVAPRDCPLADAAGRVLAGDVTLGPLPRSPIALRDGFAVAADLVADASAYAPVPIAGMPPKVEVGAAMPHATDAVVPWDAINERHGRFEAIASVVAGEGVLPAGADAAADMPMRRAGERLQGLDSAILAAAGLATVSVRAPAVGVVIGAAKITPVLKAARDIVAAFVAKAGGRVLESQASLEDALSAASADAVIAVGGTGTGAADHAVMTLAGRGEVAAHGIAISPGETAAFGFVGARPVLLVPGRIDSSLALWLLLGKPLLNGLAAAGDEDNRRIVPLARKVTSTIGLVELIPVRVSEGMAVPLGSGYLSFAALSRSDGWITVPAESEGFAAGTEIAVRPWP
jgi:molybdopterin biosynthesis enzyme